MLSKYHKECIIINCADFFCLVCECYLLSEEDAEKHIRKPVHQKTMAVTRYLESYEEDRIRQVPRGYYCEYCSVFIGTSPKVGLHVADNSHNNNKGMCQLKRINNNLIYNDMLIPEDNWHSLKDHSCSVCDTNYHNRELHKSEPKHILNLMQKKIEFGPRNFIYRVIDDNTLQCLTCNTISALKYLDLHTKDSFHIEKLNQCNKYYLSSLNNNQICKKTVNELFANDIINCKVNKENGENMSRLTDVGREYDCVMHDKDSESTKSTSSNEYYEAKSELNDIKVTSVNNKEKILDSVIYFAKNEVNINFETEMGYCKKCFKNIAFDFDLINEHIEIDKQCNRQREIRSYVPYTCDVNIPRAMTDNKDLKTDNIRDTRSISYNNDNIKEDLFHNNENSANKCFNKVTNANASNNAETNATTSKKSFLNSHGTSNNIQAQPTASNEDNDDPKSYAQENHITYNKTNNNAYCRICLSRIPASSLKCMKEHVNGMRHKKNILHKRSQEKTLTVSLKKFISEFTVKVRRFLIFTQLEYVFINQKYCLSGQSYNLIIKRGIRRRCILCEQTVDNDDVYEHIESRSHGEAMLAVPVVISLTDEFVRLIGRRLYHCGFCNLLLSDWEELQKHLQCGDHNDTKSRATTILILHMPKLRRTSNNPYF